MGGRTMRLFDNKRQFQITMYMECGTIDPDSDYPARFPCYRYFDEDGSVRYLYANDICDMAISMGIEVYGHS